MGKSFWFHSYITPGSDLLSLEQEMGVFSDKKCYLIRARTPPTQIWLEKEILKIIFKWNGWKYQHLIPPRDPLFYFLFANGGRLTFAGLAGCPVALLADAVLRGRTSGWRGVIFIRTRKASADAPWHTFWFKCPWRASCGQAREVRFMWYINW